MADRNGEVRFAYGLGEDGKARFAYRSDADGDWSTFRHDFDDNEIIIHGFADKNRDLYVSTRETGRKGLYRLNPVSGEAERLIGSDKVEITQVLWDRSGKNVIGAIVHDGKPGMLFIDAEEEASVLQRQIAASFDGQFAHIASFARDADYAVVRAEADIAPAAYFLFDIDAVAARVLVSSKGWIDPARMLPMEPFSYKARDGMTLHGYLTRPAGSEGPYPTVMVVHGGPHGVRDYWGFDHEAQLLASRGYAVLQVNFRGSTGYGSEFERVGYQHWGLEMQDDLTDAVHWAVDEGIADPDRVCIYGGSYGGFLTFMALFREPGTFKAGAALRPVTDWTQYNHTYTANILNTPDIDPEAYRKSSPIEYADGLQDHLLIAHGMIDDNVFYKDSVMLAQRLIELRKHNWELASYPMERHAYQHPEAWYDQYRRIHELFERTLKPQQ
jgi:dipeptidyl aminopeptidase/acylaminoacyl peptidase